VKTTHQQVRYTGYCDATRTNTNIYTQLLFSPSVSSIASWLFTLQRAMAVRYLSCHRLSCRKQPVFYFALAIICAKNTSSIKSILCEVILFWSEVSYSEGLGDKSATCNRGDLILRVLDYIVTISFGYILYWVCLNLRGGCFNLFCNVWVCVCVGFVMSGCLGNTYTCIYCVLYCL
jgi:hypothetical protein